MDTGYDKLSLPIRDLRRILELTPNLQCLLIKGVNVFPSDSDSQILPSHSNLKSIKIVYSSATKYLLQAYHHQVETLQLINVKLSWYSYFEALQWSNSETPVLGNLRHLKLGEFTSASEFDNFTRLLWYLPDYWKNLERLSLQYSLYHEFHKPVTKLFQVLQYLPKLKELNVGVCGNTKFVMTDDEVYEFESGILSFEHGGDNLVKLSLPVQFIKFPDTMKKIFQTFSNLKKVKLLNHDRLLLNETGRLDETAAPEKMLRLPANFGVESVLTGFLTEFVNLREIEVLSVNGDLVKKVCSVFQ